MPTPLPNPSPSLTSDAAKVVFSALIPLFRTLIGGIISAVVAVIVLRKTAANQRELEDRRFEYQQQLERERRDYETLVAPRTTP
jgi:hypothetical protein